MSEVCNEDHVIRLGASQATLSGDWKLAESGVGEGTYAGVNPNKGTNGAVVWDVEIPCTATWHVWVRFYDDGSKDSFLTQLDAEPEPAAIFEGDCKNSGNNWRWKQLNWRDPNGNNCQYVKDPWTADWAAGTHQAAFRFRESDSVARIIVTNDAGFMPGGQD